MIGEAGFGYHFNALSCPDHNDEKPQNELSAAFAVIFSTARQYRVLNIFQSWFPLLRRYVRPSFCPWQHLLTSSPLNSNRTALQSKRRKKLFAVLGHSSSVSG